MMLSYLGGSKSSGRKRSTRPDPSIFTVMSLLPTSTTTPARTAPVASSPGAF